MLICSCKLDVVILKDRSTEDNLGFVFPSACSEAERTVGCFSLGTQLQKSQSATAEQI